MSGFLEEINCDVRYTRVVCGPPSVWRVVQSCTPLTHGPTLAGLPLCQPSPWSPGLHPSARVTPELQVNALNHKPPGGPPPAPPPALATQPPVCSRAPPWAPTSPSFWNGRPPCGQSSERSLLPTPPPPCPLFIWIFPPPNSHLLSGICTIPVPSPSQTLSSSCWPP